MLAVVKVERTNKFTAQALEGSTTSRNQSVHVTEASKASEASACAPENGTCPLRGIGQDSAPKDTEAGIHAGSEAHTEQCSTAVRCHIMILSVITIIYLCITAMG